MNFVAIDVETANSNVGSICQIGLAKYVDGKLVDSYCTLVNPQAHFDPLNVGIHSITAERVADAPFIIEVFDEILAFIDDSIVVSYTLFDQRAFSNCLTHYHLPNPNWPWVDATVLVRKAFKQFAVRGYNLANVCKLLNYQFTHHDALADAKACGYVTTIILRENGCSIKDYVNSSTHKRSYNKRWRTKGPSSSNPPQTNSQNPYTNNSYPSVSARQGDEAGRYAGLNICFTGNLSISREEIIVIAAQQGFTVKAGASKKLHYLVVGTQDSAVLKGNDKSSKQRKVEELINGGVEIQIIEEQAFLQLIEKD